MILTILNRPSRPEIDDSQLGRHLGETFGQVLRIRRKRRAWRMGGGRRDAVVAAYGEKVLEKESCTRCIDARVAGFCGVLG